MALFGKIIDPHRKIAALRAQLDEALDRIQRLEIQLRRVQLGLVAQETAHDSLAAKVHGQMGGRPRKSTGVVVPAPLGAQFFPPEEQR